MGGAEGWADHAGPLTLPQREGDGGHRGDAGGERLPQDPHGACRLQTLWRPPEEPSDEGGEGLNAGSMRHGQSVVSDGTSCCCSHGGNRCVTCCGLLMGFASPLHQAVTVRAGISGDLRRIRCMWIVGCESLLRSSHIMPELSTKAPSSELVFYCSPAWPYQETPIIIEMRLKICKK